jgi:hypothetical protein
MAHGAWSGLGIGHEWGVIANCSPVVNDQIDRVEFSVEKLLVVVYPENWRGSSSRTPRNRRLTVGASGGVRL